jgi:hypothetical protein
LVLAAPQSAGLIDEAGRFGAQMIYIAVKYHHEYLQKTWWKTCTGKTNG